MTCLFSVRPSFVAGLMLTMTLVLLAGCATPGGDVVRREDVGRQALIQDGVVVSTRTVTIEGSQSGLGAITGGVVGAVAGSSVGGSRESLAVGVLGAVAGGLIGNAAERNFSQNTGVEIIVRLPNGERRSVVQPASSETFVAGDPVNIITQGGRTRVTRAAAR